MSSCHLVATISQYSLQIRTLYVDNAQAPVVPYITIVYLGSNTSSRCHVKDPPALHLKSSAE